MSKTRDSSSLLTRGHRYAYAVIICLNSTADSPGPNRRHGRHWMQVPYNHPDSRKTPLKTNTSASGTNAVRYGTMKDWVINLTVVLADGRIIKTRRRPRKSSAGYNLNGLFVGSEGTLGIITEITLKLAVIPQETSVAVATFPTIRDAAAAASKVIRAGVPIAAMELMDDVHMRVINQGPVKTGRNWREDPTIFFKFSGTNAGVSVSLPSY